MKIVVIGGGTGTFTALTGLKQHPHVDLTAIVSCADNGGSSGILRDEYGVLPPGDIRQCLVALAESGHEMRELFNYRFKDGPLAGHPIGNLLLSGLEDMHKDPFEAVRIAQRILNVRGRVVPVSRHAADLVVELDDGRRIHGEHQIDSRMSNHAIQRCFLGSPVEPNPEAIEAILDANVVVIGPGDLYTSLIPVILVNGIREALRATKATRLYVLNLTTKPGATFGFTASRFRCELQAYLDPATIQGVIVNNSKPAPHLVQRYEEAGECLVQDDLTDRGDGVVRWALLDGNGSSPKEGDALKRSFLRHNPDSLALAILACAEMFA